MSSSPATLPSNRMLSLVLLGAFDDPLQLLRTFRPHEGGARLVIVINELSEVFLQFALGMMDAVLQATPRQEAEKAFREIDPGSMRRRGVKVNLGMATEPALSRRVIVDVQIVQDDVKFALWEVSDHTIHKLQKIHRGPSLFHLSQDLAGGNFQSRQEGLGSMPYVFVGPAARLFRPQRQQGLGAIQGLNPRLLIHAQDQGIFRRMQVEAGHVQQLGLKVWVGAEGEGSKTMRLQAGSHQHAMHGTARQVHLPGQRAHGPAALKLRLLADAVLYPLPDLRPVLCRTTGARGVLQSFQ